MRFNIFNQWNPKRATLRENFECRVYLFDFDIVGFTLDSSSGAKNTDITCVRNLANLFDCGANNAKYSFSWIDARQVVLLDIS